MILVILGMKEDEYGHLYDVSIKLFYPGDKNEANEYFNIGRENANIGYFNKDWDILDEIEPDLLCDYV